MVIKLSFSSSENTRSLYSVDVKEYQLGWKIKTLGKYDIQRCRVLKIFTLENNKYSLFASENIIDKPNILKLKIYIPFQGSFNLSIAAKGGVNIYKDNIKNDSYKNDEIMIIRNYEYRIFGSYIYCQIPQEVIINIFDQLDWKELMKMRRVSMQWNLLTFKSDSWKKAHIDFKKLSYPNDLLFFLRKNQVFSKIDSFTFPNNKLFNIDLRYLRIDYNRTAPLEFVDTTLGPGDYDNVYYIKSLILRDVKDVKELLSNQFQRMFPITTKCELHGLQSGTVIFEENGKFGKFGKPYQNMKFRDDDANLITMGYLKKNDVTHLLYYSSRNEDKDIVQSRGGIDYQSCIETGYRII